MFPHFLQDQNMVEDLHFVIFSYLCPWEWLNAKLGMSSSLNLRDVAQVYVDDLFWRNNATNTAFDVRGFDGHVVMDMLHILYCHWYEEDYMSAWWVHLALVLDKNVLLEARWHCKPSELIEEERMQLAYWIGYERVMQICDTEIDFGT